VILSSPDGRLWSSRTSGSSARLRGVTFGSGLFVAVGDEATVLLSHDGQEWWSASAIPSSGVPRASPLAIEMRFLAVGDAGIRQFRFSPVLWSLSFTAFPRRPGGVWPRTQSSVIVGTGRAAAARILRSFPRVHRQVKDLEAVTLTGAFRCGRAGRRHGDIRDSLADGQRGKLDPPARCDRLQRFLWPSGRGLHAAGRRRPVRVHGRPSFRRNLVAHGGGRRRPRHASFQVAPIFPTWSSRRTRE
jgi:hypothetical protein